MPRPDEVEREERRRKDEEEAETPRSALMAQMFVIRFRLHRLTCLSADGYITAGVGGNRAQSACDRT